MTIDIKQHSRSIAVLAFTIALACVILPLKAHATGGPGVHTYTNSDNGDVFLGGNYLEIGISKSGSFGTSEGFIPENFYGGNDETSIGLATNPAGFNVEPDLRMDYILPGTPEERWVVGYKIGGVPTIGSNSLLEGPINIRKNVVTNMSSGSQLRARSVGTFNKKLQITQNISFGVDSRYFKNVVNLKNVGAVALNSVRYMRSMDPDNTGDQEGNLSTKNQILYTNQAGDGMAVVVADTSNNSSDPVFLVNGSHSPFLLFSKDPRARVSTFDFTNTDPYQDEAYDDALPKGTSIIYDNAITITFDVGTINPGQTKKFTYYTSLDNRSIATILNNIKCGSSTCN